MRESMFGGSEAVLYKSKRQKFMPLSGDASAMGYTVSDALGGGGSWTKSSLLEFSEVKDEL